MTKRPYNPVEETTNYRKQTANRGYGHFSAKAVEIQREKNAEAGIDRNALRDMAKKHVDDYMQPVNDTAHPDHLKQRKEYYNKYGGDRKNIEEAKFSELCDMVGYAPLPMRNTDYERKILEQPARNPTNDQVREHKVFSDLMNAKWDAVGYDGDKAVIDEFNQEYGSVAISSDGDRGAKGMADIMNRLSEKHSATEE